MCGLTVDCELPLVASSTKHLKICHNKCNVLQNTLLPPAKDRKIIIWYFVNRGGKGVYFTEFLKTSLVLNQFYKGLFRYPPTITLRSVTGNRLVESLNVNIIVILCNIKCKLMSFYAIKVRR